MKLCDYIYQQSGAEFCNKLLLIDKDGIEEKESFSSSFSEHGFTIIKFTDDLSFRIKWESVLNTKDSKLAIVAGDDVYIPYDIQKKCTRYEVSYKSIYPRLNSDYFKAKSKVNHELVLRAYQHDYDKHTTQEETEQFIQKEVYCVDNVRIYTRDILAQTLAKARKAQNHKDWFYVAEKKAGIDVICAEYNLDFDTAEINRLFRDWVLADFGKQSMVIDKSSPVLVKNVMEFIKERSNKFVIIVMDGMSEFDWSIISKSFSQFNYTKSSVMAMIPTVTAVSRQCLLSGKMPYQLSDPWHQSKEKSEFIHCASELGFKNNQIEYLRNYDAQFDMFTKCGAVIIMDIDENVHGQKQGRIGMFNDVTVMANNKKLADLTEDLLKQGFDVYVTADHGNTPCTGMGKLIGSGVETETKSRRMLVLNDFADKEEKIQKYGMLDYPKYYLPKQYDYLICDVGTSFDPKGEDVMSHGGITIDEVIVPFIMLKAGEYNG